MRSRSPSLGKENIGIRRVSRGTLDALQNGMAPQTPTLDLSQIWRDLVSGQVTIVETFSSDERNYLVLSLASERRPRPKDAHFQWLELVLRGVPQKRVAMDAGFSLSSVAVACREALAYVGVECRPSKAPALLCLIAHAAHQPELGLNAWVCDVEHPSGPHRALSAPRLERRMTRRLPPAQTAVLRLLLDGKSHVEIASERSTSARTVANQLAAVMSALRVSGRMDVIRMLTTMQCSGSVSGEGAGAA